MATTPTQFWHRLVWAAACLHGLATLALALTRLYTDKAALSDVGLFDQSIWTTAAYGVPTTTTDFPHAVRNFLSVRFVPLLLVAVPFHAVPVEGLLVVQAALVALTAVILYWAVIRMGAPPRAACLWSLTYLLNPLLLNGAVWDFHERALALPLIAAAYYALFARKRVLFATALALLLMCEEHFGVAMFGFGLAWAFEHRREQFGLVVAAAGLLAVPSIAFTMMSLNPPDDPLSAIGGAVRLARYSWLAHPSQWLPAARTLLPQGVEYLFFYLAAPFVGISLLSPVLLLPGLADLAANLLSLNPMPRSLYAYHSMTVIPVMVIAAVRTSQRWGAPERWARLSLAVTLVFAYAAAPVGLPGATNVWRAQSIVLRRDPAIAEIQRLMNESMRVSAESGVGAFFVRRLHVYPFPQRMNEADAVVLRLEYPYQDRRYAPFAIPYGFDADLHLDEMKAGALPAMHRLLDDAGFGIVYWNRNWLLAVRGATDRVDRRAVRERLAAYEREFS